MYLLSSLLSSHDRKSESSVLGQVMQLETHSREVNSVEVRKKL